MPSLLHEILVQLFTETPALGELLGLLGAPSPGPLLAAHPNFAEPTPVELRCDALLVAGEPDAPSAWALLEVQTSIDRRKLRSIPLAYELARARYRDADGDVVLVTASEHVAAYYDRHPFAHTGPLGSRRSLEVVRVDLARIPADTLLGTGRPALGLSAVAAHGRSVSGGAIARRALTLAAASGPPLESWLADAIFQLVDARVREELEEHMHIHGYRTPFLRDAFAEGKAQGKAEALFRVLEHRGLALTASAHERIVSETDLAVLDLWLERALSAASLDDVLQP